MGDRRAVIILFSLLVVGGALGNLSQTGLNAMLPVVMGDFGVDVAAGQWLTTGYMLVLGIAVPVSTYLGRRVSLKDYLLIAFGLFAAGSLLDWVAWGFAPMLIGRILQAVAVGIIVPLMQDTAMSGFPPGQQATAMGIGGIAMGFAPNVGPTVGGILDSAFGWRSFFVLLTLASAVLFALTLAFVRRQPPKDPTERFQTVSFIYSTLGFGGILLGLSQASSFGLASLWVWVPIAVGAVFLVLFARLQRRLEKPLLDLRIFRTASFDWALAASIFLFACYMGITLVIPLYVQDVLGWSSLEAGLVIFPSTITALIFNPLAGWLADRTSVRLVTLIFGTCLVVGSIGCVFVGEHTTFLELAVWQTIRGSGVSGLIGPLITYALRGLQGPLIPHGSSASVIIRQVAATFGTAIMVFCIAVGRDLAAGGASPALPYQLAFGFSAVMACLCFAVIVLRIRKDGSRAEG